MSEERQRRLSPREWAEAGALYETGEFTQTQIAKKYGITTEAVNRKFVKLGLRRGAGSERHAEAVADEIAKSANTDAVLTARRIRDTKEQHYEWSAGLARMAMHQIAAASKEGVPVASKLPNLKAIEKTMQIVQRAREERWAVLGLDREDFIDDEELPELMIQEMSAEEALEKQIIMTDITLGLVDEGEDDSVVVEEIEVE